MKQAAILMNDESWARKVDMQFRVVSTGDVRFDSAKTRNLQAQVDLRVRGTAADIALLGKITLLEGQVDFAGNHYTINRGDIEFTNPFRVDPILNLDVSTRAQQYDIGLDFSGPLDKLQVNYRSDPPLPVADIQALLFLGRTPATSGPNAALTNPALQSALTGNTVLQQAMSATSGSRLERFFGAARLKFDPQSGSVEQNSSARLTLEQQVARDVTLTYITSLNNTQQQIVQVEWAVSPRLSIRAIRDQDGLFGIDLRWKKRFR
jgi:translocation and assembly module TamB